MFSQNRRGALPLRRLAAASQFRCAGPGDRLVFTFFPLQESL